MRYFIVLDDHSRLILREELCRPGSARRSPRLSPNHLGSASDPEVNGYADRASGSGNGDERGAEPEVGWCHVGGDVMESIRSVIGSAPTTEDKQRRLSAMIHQLQIIRNQLTRQQQQQQQQVRFLSVVFKRLLMTFTARRYAKRGICRRRVSVCPSVCHSPVLYKKTAKHRITQIMPHDSPGTLVFWNDNVTNEDLTLLTIATFVAIRQKSTYHAKCLRMFCTYLDLLYRFGRHISGDDFSNIRLAVAQGTLLWQPVKSGRCLQTSM